MSSDTISDVLAGYYDSWKGGPAAFDAARLRSLLADDLDFEGPIAGHRREADGFVQALAGRAPAGRRLPSGDQGHRHRLRRRLRSRTGPPRIRLRASRRGSVERGGGALAGRVGGRRGGPPRWTRLSAPGSASDRGRLR